MDTNSTDAPTATLESPENLSEKEIAAEKVVDDSITKKYPVPLKLSLEIEKRFTYHAPHPDQLPRYGQLRALARVLAKAIVEYTPPSREQALALTKLEETVMHANSAIAREPRSEAPVGHGG